MTSFLGVFKRAGLLGVATATLAAGLAACGGGEQKVKFDPSRIVAFGDENSLIAPNGYQYTTNNEQTAGLTPCRTSPIWIEIVAQNYGISFGECSGVAPRAAAQMKAAYGSTVAQMRAAVNAFHAASPLNSGDLVTLTAGTYDVLAIYNERPNATDTELAAMRTRAYDAGYDLGQLVFDVIDRGAKVAFGTVPDLGLAPIALPADASDRRRAVVLTSLSVAFNDGLSRSVGRAPNGGGRQGVVLQFDQLMSAYNYNRDGYYSQFGDRANAACVVNNTASPQVPTDPDKLVTDCKSSVVTSVRSGWGSALWAGKYHFGATAHWTLGGDLFQRIRNNPL